MDADILWLLDLRAEAGVRPHDSSHCGVLLDGSYLYVNTSNGLTSKHDGVDKPQAPSLVVVDRETGRLLAREDEGISQRIFHCTWSSPALGQLDGRRTVFFCGGDGVCYGFDALKPADRDALVANQAPASLDCVWKFDCDPAGPKEDIHSYIRNRRESPSNIKSMPVVHQDRLYVTVGGDIWWGKRQAWLQCIQIGGHGDVTADALRWSHPVERHCCATPAIHEGLAYVADCAGKVHCIDVASGETCWVQDIEYETWASPLVADGKVFVGTRRGDFWILAAGRSPQVHSSIRLDAPIMSTAVAANGALYVSTMETLYALRQGANSATSEP